MVGRRSSSAVAGWARLCRALTSFVLFNYQSRSTICPCPSGLFQKEKDCYFPGIGGIYLQMQELDDNALLREYAERGSGPAFAALVERHINKVYSVALRRTGNAHQAEEITQAVFVLLAQKSRRLGSRVVLSGWLYQTAQWKALTFLRGEVRRVHREQEAYMQTALNNPDSETWRQIAPVLEDAMAALNETDRHAIVLRFFDGKSMREVGMALGANEGATKMRVGRALEKLQKFFFRRGIKSTTATLAGAISNYSVQPAPAALAKTITAAALAKGAVAGVSTLTLTKTALVALTMKTKITIISIILAAFALGAGVYVAHRVVVAVRRNTPVIITSLPHNFPNQAFFAGGDRDGRFRIDVDSDTRRTPDSAPAIHIRGPVSGLFSSPPHFPDRNRADLKANNISYVAFPLRQNSPLLGQHVAITGWMKTRNVQKDCVTFIAFWSMNRQLIGVDGMDNRAISGTTDWQEINSVTDIPNQPCVVILGVALHGPGELWADDFQMAPAPPDAEITDYRAWRQTCSTPGTYSETLDSANSFNGNPTICLAYDSEGMARRGSWTWWGRKIWSPEVDQYIGHTVRMSGWVKTSAVSVRLQPSIRPWDGNNHYGADSMAKDYSLKRTLDWTHFSVTCDIPTNTVHIDTSFIFWGSGKVWIDTNSLAFEVVK
jgi:RNA polymerase sigma factor (sigma-70 family)